MKRFRFRLEKVLDARSIAERDAQTKLGEAQQILIALEAKRDEIIAELDFLSEQQREILSNGVTAGKAMQHHRWQRELTKQLREQNDKCREAEINVAKRRTKLLHATRERQVLDRLKEKRKSEHEKLNQKEQQAILDEIGGRCKPSGTRQPDSP